MLRGCSSLTVKGQPCPSASHATLVSWQSHLATGAGVGAASLATSDAAMAAPMTTHRPAASSIAQSEASVQAGGRPDRRHRPAHCAKQGGDGGPAGAGAGTSPAANPSAEAKAHSRKTVVYDGWQERKEEAGERGAGESPEARRGYATVLFAGLPQLLRHGRSWADEAEMEEMEKLPASRRDSASSPSPPRWRRSRGGMADIDSAGPSYSSMGCYSLLPEPQKTSCMPGVGSWLESGGAGSGDGQAASRAKSFAGDRGAFAWPPRVISCEAAPGRSRSQHKVAAEGMKGLLQEGLAPRPAALLRNDSCMEAAVEMVCKASATPKVSRMVAAVAAGIEAQQQPEAAAEGMGGTYFFKNAAGVKVAILKPCDEEPLAPNNPKGFIGREMGAPGMKPTVRVGEAALREVAAFLLDHQRFAGVPATVLVQAQHPVLHSRSCAPLAPPPEAGLLDASGSAAKLGSLQEFVQHKCDTNEMGASRFALRDVQRIGILDIRLLNSDRHAGNILVRPRRPSSANLSALARLAEQQYELVPIDHGFCLPEALEPPFFEWLHWPQAMMPFGAEELAYIRGLDAQSDCAQLQRELPQLRPESLAVLQLSTTLLQMCAEAGLSLCEIGTMMSRPCVGLEDEQSELERVCARALASSSAWRPAGCEDGRGPSGAAALLRGSLPLLGGAGFKPVGQTGEAPTQPAAAVSAGRASPFDRPLTPCGVAAEPRSLSPPPTAPSVESVPEHEEMIFSLEGDTDIELSEALFSGYGGGHAAAELPMLLKLPGTRRDSALDAAAGEAAAVWKLGGSLDGRTGDLCQGCRRQLAAALDDRGSGSERDATGAAVRQASVPSPLPSLSSSCQVGLKGEAFRRLCRDVAAWKRFLDAFREELRFGLQAGWWRQRSSYSGAGGRMSAPCRTSWMPA